MKKIFWTLTFSAILLSCNQSSASYMTDTFSDTLAATESETFVSEDSNIEVDAEPSFSWDNMPIDSDVEIAVSSSQYGIDPDVQQKLMKIISDPNADSEGRSGKICEIVTANCEWCGRDFDNSSKIYTYKEVLSKYFSIGAAYIMGFELLYGGEEAIDKFQQDLKDVISEYEEGIRYTCVPSTDTFCSKKCESESKNQQ